MTLGTNLRELDRRVLHLEVVDDVGDRLADRLQLRRSRTDRHLAGVCGGVGRRLGVDARAVRIAFLLLAPVSVPAYAVGAFLLPLDD